MREDGVTVIEFDGKGSARKDLLDASGDLEGSLLEVLRLAGALRLRAGASSWSASSDGWSPYEDGKKRVPPWNT